mgnify:CR=1 FL=1
MNLEHTDEVKRHVFDFLTKFIHEEYDQPFVVDPDEMEHRIATCRSCEHYSRKVKDGGKRIKEECQLCGCLIEQRAFEALDSCPINKWEPHFDSFVRTCYDYIVMQEEKKNGRDTE